MLKFELAEKQSSVLEYLIIIAFSLFPLLNSFPYRINIFLSWEGAYRLYLGQVPYRDFGLPMGFGYWLIPAFFFKLFGPYMYTLIKAQVFINIMSGLAFGSIFKSFGIHHGLRLVSLLLFIISFSFFNFWPWYNHSVIVFELVSFSLLLKFILRTQTNWRSYLYLTFSSLFLFLSFFTKQDGGGLAFLISLFIVIYHSLTDRKYLDLLSFVLTYTFWACLFVLPFLQHDFTYWFNLGQEPHYSRIELWDFVKTTFGASMWEKFYLCGFILILASKAKDLKAFVLSKKEFLFFLFSLGILVQAILFQVTSYTPPDNNIFFHSFMFAYFLSLVDLKLSFQKLSTVVLMSMLVMLWWSGAYWKYVDRKIERLFPEITKIEEGKISKNTYALTNAGEDVKMENWVFSDLDAFRNIYMPESTVAGIDRLLQMPQLEADDLSVLNMSELTPLAHEIGYELETGRPLWYHKGVGIFQKQIDNYVSEIQNDYYDIVLFETIPYLNNFYPEEVREALIKNYDLQDRFLAPRRPTDSHIEVYVKRQQP